MTDIPPAFNVLEISATGTFGIVCVAEDLRDGRLVALKVIKREHLDRPRILARARDEARVMMELKHPGIVKVHELLHIQDRPIVVMEWVRGQSLSRLLRAYPRGVPTITALSIIRQASCALDYAWTATPSSGGPPMRVIHRDIKPSNLLLGIDGSLKLVDFGIAKARLVQRESETLSMVLGARGYLAPERLDGGDDAPSADVYALGVVLHELLCAEHIEMSLHPAVHADSVATAARFLRPRDLEPESRSELQELIHDMCAYSGDARPSHAEVVGRIDALMEQIGGTQPALDWAETHVWPLYLERTTAPPAGHTAVSDLAFLDTEARAFDRQVAPDVDATIADILSDPNWTAQRSALDRITALNPHWSPQPFLAVLKGRPRSWWRPWSSTPLESSELLVLLKYLSERPTDPLVVQGVRPLCAHPETVVAAAAQSLIERCTEKSG